MSPAEQQLLLRFCPACSKALIHCGLTTSSDGGLTPSRAGPVHYQL